MSKYVLLIIFIILSINIKGQRWKSDRHSVVGSIGMNHFMGDLGGGGKDAAHFMGVRDLDFATTRPVITANYRYRVLETLAVKAGFGYAILAANDANSSSKGRKYRNLHFKTNLWQFNVHGEYYFIRERLNPRYSFTSLHGMRNLSAYVFTGVSVNMFNPKAELNGEWHELQPLGTEGQGIGDNPGKYSKIAIGWPIGIGVKYSLNKDLAIGLEISNTYTNSDYIDDAHNTYYDNNAIRAEYGNIAAELADRHINILSGEPDVPYESGKTMRGNPKYNDAFVYTVITVTYKLKKDKRGLPKF